MIFTAHEQNKTKYFFHIRRYLRFSQLILVFFCLFVSCVRGGKNTEVLYESAAGALPSAILKTGEHPLWFQLTESGPVYLESIKDAENTCAFIPWPWAVHVRFFYKRDGELVMAVNRDGFMKLVVQEQGLVLYHFSGGEYWKQYTIGGFFNYNGQDTVLLYLDERFLDTEMPHPAQNTWAYNMESNAPFAVSIPVFEAFHPVAGRIVDTIRLGSDGYWYYRVKETKQSGEIQMIRTENLSQAGINISIEDFFNSAPKAAEINDPALPSLPPGYVYTGIARIGNNLFASWEEQDEFCIGAAGFMLIREQAAVSR